MRVWFAGGGTGGHLYPALAIARALIRVRPDVRPLIVGARRGIERDVLPQSGFEYLLLDLHPLYRTRPWLNWRTAAGAFTGQRALREAARSDAPAAVVGTGGYAAALALGFAVKRGIPMVLQEQNSFPGLTTRLFSRFARQIHLGFPEAERFLRPGDATVVRHSGNPIEPPPADRVAAAREIALGEWGLTDGAGPVLLVFGGSQGSRAMNTAVDEWLRRGPPSKMQVLWLTGRGHYERHADLDGGRIRVRPFVSPMSTAYAAADLALARAGAMSTAELCAWGIPAVLVPLPIAAADHQTANARALERAGAAIVLPQNELSAELLERTIGAVLSDANRRWAMSRVALARARPHAADEIARHLSALLPPPNAG